VRGSDTARVSRYLDVSTPEALRERLRGDGISHVAVITTSEELTPPRSGCSTATRRTSSRAKKRRCSR
jgi:hypothetical protein